MTPGLALLGYWLVLRLFWRLPWYWLLLATPFFLPIAESFRLAGAHCLLWFIIFLRIPSQDPEQRATQFKALIPIFLSLMALLFPATHFILWGLIPLIPFHLFYRDPLLRVNSADSFAAALFWFILSIDFALRGETAYPIWALISALYLALLSLAQKDIRSVLAYRVLSLGASIWAFSGPDRMLGWTFALILTLETCVYAYLAAANSFTTKFSAWTGRKQFQIWLALGVVAVGYSPLGPPFDLASSGPMLGLVIVVSLLNSLGPLRILAHLGPQSANYYPNPVQTNPQNQIPLN